MQVAHMNVATPGWLLANTDQLFLDNLGPRISTSAKSYCPVFGGQNSTATAVSLAIAASVGHEEPGALRDSIRFFLAVHTLIVMATGNSERTYAAYVELGHHIVVFGHPTGRFKPPQSFLRPALYQVRGTVLR